MTKNKVIRLPKVSGHLIALSLDYKDHLPKLRGTVFTTGAKLKLSIQLGITSTSVLSKALLRSGKNAHIGGLEIEAIARAKEKVGTLIGRPK